MKIMDKLISNASRFNLKENNTHDLFLNGFKVCTKTFDLNFNRMRCNNQSQKPNAD